MRRTTVGLVVTLILVLMLAAGAFVIDATGRGGAGRELNIPLGGSHRFTVMLLPCSAAEPGSIVMGRDLFISSREPRTLRIPITPPCP